VGRFLNNFGELILRTQKEWERKSCADLSFAVTFFPWYVRDTKLPFCWVKSTVGILDDVNIKSESLVFGAACPLVCNPLLHQWLISVRHKTSKRSLLWLNYISKGNTTIVIGGCRAVRGIINDFLIHPNSQTQSSNNNYHPMKFRKKHLCGKNGHFLPN